MRDVRAVSLVWPAFCGTAVQLTVCHELLRGEAVLSEDFLEGLKQVIHDAPPSVRRSR